MSESTFEQIISELGFALGIPELAPTHANFCQLVFDERQVMQVIYIAERGQVLLSCVLGGQPPHARDIELIAKINFLQAGGGPIVCLAPDGLAHMQLGIPAADCSQGRLPAAISALLNEAETWQTRTEKHSVRDSALRNPAFMLRSSV